MSGSCIILGIDPGFGRAGYGVIEKTGGNSWRALDFGCVATSPRDQYLERLKAIHVEFSALIKKYRPTLVAIEKLFFFKNVITAMQVAEARGVMLLTAIEQGREVQEYTPLQVKQALTGYGRAEKGQIGKMVGMILGIKKKITPDDAADALAIALTAGQSLWLNDLSFRSQ